jgi:pimeloyl-ACP methyl ester carboxylesterase
MGRREAARARESAIDVDGFRLRVYSSRGPSATGRAGRQQYPPATAPLPVVLVHGIGMSHRYFARLQALFARSRDVHALDLPGFGRFGRPRDPLPPERMAALIGDVLARMGVLRAVLVGHSMGAQWVVELARQRPDLAASVVLIGPVVDDAHRTVWAQTRAMIVESLGETPAANTIVFTDYLRCGMPWYLTQLRHMLTYPIEDRIEALDAPVLLLRGGNDPVAGLDWCRRLRARARAATLAVVPGKRHAVQFTAPRAVASAIDAFLGDRRSPRNAGDA